MYHQHRDITVYWKIRRVYTIVVVELSLFIPKRAHESNIIPRDVFDCTRAYTIIICFCQRQSRATPRLGAHNPIMFFPSDQRFFIFIFPPTYIHVYVLHTCIHCIYTFIFTYIICMHTTLLYRESIHRIYTHVGRI